MSIEDIEHDLEKEDRREESASAKASARQGKKHSCFRFCLGWIVAIIIIVLIAFATVVFVVGPIVQRANQIPNDFPKEFALYQADKAKIMMQNPENRQKFVSLVGKMPDWVLKPIWGLVNDKVEQELSNTLGSEVTIPEGFSVSDFKDILNSTNLADAQTVWLSWDKLDKSKEQLADLYKGQLGEADFEFKENLSDYKIDIDFWKDGMFGNLSLTDDESDKNYGDAEMMVNYFQPTE